MAFTQFPNQQYFIVLATDTTSGLGYFNLSEALELKHIMATIYIQGNIPSSFTARLKIYPTTNLITPIFSSEYVTISNDSLDKTIGQNWIGNIYFDFEGNPLNPNLDYFFAIETVGYTRNADTYYLGINLDWYSPVNTQFSTSYAGARIRLLGLK